MDQFGKKVVIQKPGNYDRLILSDFVIPSVKDDEVLIECHACGVNFADCCVRMGVYSSAKEFVGWPITPGFEVAGVIKKVGKRVKQFSVGQRVSVLTLFGGYTSHLVVQASQVFHLPDSLSYEEGASFPTIFLTAYYGLLEMAHPRKNDKILVHSAAGGVGSALVQLGKLSGCHVVGVVGAPDKVKTVKQLGADVVIDKSSCLMWKELEKACPEGFDIILDANGPETLRESYRHLAKGGKLIVYGFHTMMSKGRGSMNWFKVVWDYLKMPRFNPLNMTNENRSVMAFNLSYLFNKKDLFHEAMRQLYFWVEHKMVVPPPIRTFPLEKVADAHRALESGKTIGKLILVPYSERS